MGGVVGPATACTRVVLVDDHTLIRQSLARIVEAAGSFEVVAEAAGSDEALAVVSLHRPDLLVLDVGLPGRGGLAVAAAVKKSRPGTRVIMLTMHEDDATISQAIAAGVDGYVLKSASTQELIAALNAVAAGDSYLSPAVARTVMHRSAARSPVDLTARELEIVQMLATGMRPAQIARALTLSLRTVRNHLANVYAKLGVASAAQAVAEAYARGLVARR